MVPKSAHFAIGVEKIKIKMESSKEMVLEILDNHIQKIKVGSTSHTLHTKVNLNYIEDPVILLKSISTLKKL